MCVCSLLCISKYSVGFLWGTRWIDYILYLTSAIIALQHKLVFLRWGDCFPGNDFYTDFKLLYSHKNSNKAFNKRIPNNYGIVMRKPSLTTHNLFVVSSADDLLVTKMGNIYQKFRCKKCELCWRVTRFVWNFTKTVRFLKISSPGN